MKLLKPSLTYLRSELPLIGAERSTEQQARKRLYDSVAWAQARSAYLRTHPACVRCGRGATVVDHVLGHGDDWRSTFWNRGSWQALCLSCHSRKTSSEEQHGAGGASRMGGVTRVPPGGGWDGSV